VLGFAVWMAVHTGEAQLPDGGNYIGPAVIRGARLRSISALTLEPGLPLGRAPALGRLVERNPRAPRRLTGHRLVTENSAQGGIGHH